jgi:hypothetical protein
MISVLNGVETGESFLEEAKRNMEEMRKAEEQRKAHEELMKRNI